MILSDYTTMRAAFDVSGGIKGKHGYELWPYHLTPGGWTPPPSPFTDLTVTKPLLVWPVVGEVNGGAADTTYGVSEYTWYLEQKSDLPDHQYLSISHPTPGVNTYSSIVNIEYSPVGAAKFPAVPTMDDQIELFKFVYLFVQRKKFPADNAIQWLDLTKYFFSQAP
ncbi:MAG: hypothetical protein KKC50_08335 [Candidatus Omnitrophica bacterium]|nr:hypothetical protein [Candidatus Omnitrophota bacterium]MBU1657390.1 hypothetical protein [Candidatus Omnitrophota bacterium]